MVARNLTLPYDFVCFGNNFAGVDKSIKCVNLPKLPLEGWWYKLWFLSNEFPLEGNILFLDLDLIIFKNIDKLFDYAPNQFCIIRDFNRSLIKNWDRYNSSVFKFQSKKYDYVYQNFIKNASGNSRWYHGDQDFLYKNLNSCVYWPDEWIQSYKWEMRDRNDLVLINKKRNFKIDREPIIKLETSIAVFHGEPNPQDCNDNWVVRNWR